MPVEPLPNRLDRPVFIVGAPRSGTSAVFDRLRRAVGAYSIGADDRNAIERIPGMFPADRAWHSDMLSAVDATGDLVEAMTALYRSTARDRDGQAAPGDGPIRLIEKSARHGLRVPFLAEAFPDALFVYVHRDPAASISGMLEGWRSERFITYRDLDGRRGSMWSMPLVPGWRDIIGLTFPHIVAQQWATITTCLLDGLEELPSDRWCVVDYEAFTAAPNRTAGALCAQLGLEWDRPLLPPPPAALDSMARPKHAQLVDEFAHIVGPVARRAEEVVDNPPAGPDFGAVSAASSRRRRVHAPSADLALPVVESASGPVQEVLQRLNTSLVLSTYSGGRVMILRPGSGTALELTSTAFDRPSGIAVGVGRLAIASGEQIHRFENHAGLIDRLPGSGHDGCFVPSSTKFTGEVGANEMAYAGRELWFVNSTFSCLATIDQRHSFVPRWRPSFVSSLAPEDRCHLNGLAIRNNSPAFVTAMAMTDDPQGWRREKSGTGVVVDVESGSLVAHGLTMPHSPRWHDGTLWVLDSGNGTLCTIDIVNGQAEPVVRLPGFARGLVFVGPYAFVGLSILREHVFNTLPIADRVSDRLCGIWMVDTRSGEVAGHIRFGGDLNEIADVQALRGMLKPELLDATDPAITSAYLLPAGALASVRMNDDESV